MCGTELPSLTIRSFQSSLSIFATFSFSAIFIARSASKGRSPSALHSRFSCHMHFYHISHPWYVKIIHHLLLKLFFSRFEASQKRNNNSRPTSSAFGLVKTLASLWYKRFRMHFLLPIPCAKNIGPQKIHLAVLKRLTTKRTHKKSLPVCLIISTRLKDS